MQVQLQEEDEKTCVACSAINALRHFGQNAPYARVVEALQLPTKPSGGSYVSKAAKWLRRNCDMRVVKSQPRFLHMEPWAAALEVANRWEGFLADGYVGIIGHNTSAGRAHAVVLYRITRDHGEPLLHCYDSAQRHKLGFHTYRAIDFVWWVQSPDGMVGMTRWLEMDELHRRGHPIHPTGRVAYFVHPALPAKSCLMAGHNPFRSRKQQRATTGTFGAIGPPEG